MTMAHEACWRLEGRPDLKLRLVVMCRAAWAAEGACETWGGTERCQPVCLFRELWGSAGPWGECAAWDLVIEVITVRLCQGFVAVCFLHTEEILFTWVTAFA